MVVYDYDLGTPQSSCPILYTKFQFVHDEKNLSDVAAEVDDVLLTLLVDEIVNVRGSPEELRQTLSRVLLSPVAAPGCVASDLSLSRCADHVFMAEASGRLASAFRLVHGRRKGSPPAGLGRMESQKNSYSNLHRYGTHSMLGCY